MNTYTFANYKIKETYKLQYRRNDADSLKISITSNGQIQDNITS